MHIWMLELIFAHDLITRVYSKVPGLSHKEIYAYKNKYQLRSNTNGYGDKTH